MKYYNMNYFIVLNDMLYCLFYPGGVWKTVVFGFGGVSIDKEQRLVIQPKLPEQWEKLTFRIHYQGRFLEVTIDKDNVTVTRLSGEELAIYIKGEETKI